MDTGRVLASAETFGTAETLHHLVVGCNKGISPNDVCRFGRNDSDSS